MQYTNNFDVLLLGNGFDLYHDLPTRYSNFVNTVNFLKEDYTDEMNTIGTVFNNPKLHSADSEIRKCYEKHSLIYSTFPLDKDLIEYLRKSAKNNFWFEYMSKIAERIDTWIDFEKEIEKVIIAFENFFKKNYGKSIRFENISECDRRIINIFNFFYSKIEDGMIVNGNQIRWEVKGDFLSTNTLSNTSTINKEKIISFIYDQLIELSCMLKAYLRCFVECMLGKIKRGDLEHRCKKISSASHVFTLNYTSTFEMLYASRRDVSIYHIHGQVGGDIVLGLNSNDFDELDKLNTDFLCFKKYYQRVYFKTDSEYIAAIKRPDIFDNYSTIDLSVIGHSLDASDKEIITTLFERADKITVYCHNREIIGDYIKNLVTIYGKNEFDKLRSDKDLTFRIMNEDNC